MMRSVKKWLSGLLCLALLLTVLPTTALADDTGMTFEDLQSALLNENGSGIYFRPSPTFVWPDEGGTLTFQQNLYLEGDWEIPKMSHLHFPKAAAGSGSAGRSKMRTR